MLVGHGNVMWHVNGGRTVENLLTWDLLSPPLQVRSGVLCVATAIPLVEGFQVEVIHFMKRPHGH